MGDLDGRVAIVTGGGAGLGRASALALASAGAAVVVADRDLPGATGVAAEIATAGGDALALVVDVADDDAVREMVRRAVDRFGGVDVLMNSAAEVSGEFTARDGNVVTADLASWDRIIAVNLTGTMLCCRHAIPEMLRRGGGSIINMSSVSSLLADVDHCAYGASKAAVNMLTKYTAAAFGKQGIRVNALAPSVVLSEQIVARLPPAKLEEWAGHHLTPRLGVPADVAAAVVFLASDSGAFWTGQVLSIDGGMSAHLPTYAAVNAQRSQGV